MHADRNLLFGILALQTDLITRDALIAGMNAWAVAKDKPLGQILVEQGAMRPENRALLEPLVEANLQAHGGDPQRSLAALSSVGSVREDLGRIADPELQASLAHVAPVAAGQSGTLVQTAPPDAPRFRILRPHAKGGLGEVFVAEDTELHRSVALKEMQSHQAQQPDSRLRFVLEAEITGGLEHPGIVPVYGLGHYVDGRPFYAMRFIQGDSLQEAMDRFHKADQPGRDPRERNLALRGLLGRFVDVCQAIAYAHSRGVLHRDLKPANVMLGKYGETLVVDWGLAKIGARDRGREASDGGEVLIPASASRATPTQLGTAIGTPGYMSPEQAAGELDKLGPASDVYSLGAVLYCLVTGQPPCDGADVGEILRKAQRGDFPMPRQRKANVPAALEAVCLKALALRPEDRYGSPTALAEDVEHWLADEPITGYAEPVLVRAGRFVRKHKPLVATAAAILLTATIGLAVGLFFVNAEKNRTESQRIAAENSAQEARDREAETAAVLDFVEKKVFAAARPKTQEGGMGYDVMLADAVKAALPFVQTSFTDQPLIEARLRMTLGTSFSYLSKFDIAVEQFQAARTILAKYRGPNHADTLKSMNNLAICLRDVGRFADALKLHEETLSLRKAMLGSDNPDTLSSMNNLAISYTDVGRHAEALKLREETLALQKAILGPDNPKTLYSMTNLAISYAALGRHAEALKLREETLELLKVKLGPDHPDTLGSMNNLSNSYSLLGRHTDALKLREETLALRKAKLGTDHADMFRSMNNLADSYSSVGRHADALKLYQETLALRKAKLGPNHPDTINSMSNLADGYDLLGRHAEAFKLFEETLAIRKVKLGINHPHTLMSMGNLASSYRKLGRYAEALKLFQETLATMKVRLGPDHPHTLWCMGNSADVLVQLNRSAEAIPLIDECLKRAARKVVDPELIPLVVNLRLRHFEKTQDVAGCRQTAAMWEELKREDADSLYVAARLRSVIAAVIGAQGKSEATTKSATNEADLALARLKQAVAAGYKDAAQMNKDKDLDVLRNREDFKKLLAEIEAKANGK